MRWFGKTFWGKLVEEKGLDLEKTSPSFDKLSDLSPSRSLPKTPMNPQSYLNRKCCLLRVFSQEDSGNWSFSSFIQDLDKVKLVVSDGSGTKMRVTLKYLLDLAKQEGKESSPSTHEHLSEEAEGNGFLRPPKDYPTPE